MVAAKTRSAPVVNSVPTIVQSPPGTQDSAATWPGLAGVGPGMAWPAPQFPLLISVATKDSNTSPPNGAGAGTAASPNATQLPSDRQPTLVVTLSMVVADGTFSGFAWLQVPLASSAVNTPTDGTVARRGARHGVDDAARDGVRADSAW